MFLHYPTSWVFASKHKNGSGLVFVITATALGIILEDLGARAERICEGQGSDDSDWYDYLALAFDPQPIGLRYIGTVVLRMKFEFGMGFGSVITAGGIFCTPISLTMKLLSISIVGALTFYFLHEGSCSVRLLKKTRSELLNVFSPRLQSKKIRPLNRTRPSEWTSPTDYNSLSVGLLNSLEGLERQKPIKE